VFSERPRWRTEIAPNPNLSIPGAAMNPCDEIRTDCDARFEALEAWQIRQNGSLQRIEGTLRSLFIAMLVASGALIASLVLLVLNLMRGCL
jgi:hypothetical protein